MTGVVLSLADRQPVDVQRRAAAACARLRQPAACDLRGMVSPWSDDATDAAPLTLDAWYRSQSLPKGRIRLRMTMPPGGAQLYGLPATARLVDLRDMVTVADHWSVAVLATIGGHIVGVAAPDGSGVGVIWRLARKANDYALRLSVEHDMPIREVRL
jgi:hypothetical protein